MLNFNSKVSLDKFLKQWGVSTGKMVFPYQHYKSIEQMRQEIDFPPYAAFYSDLKGRNVDYEDYKQARDEYYRRLNLPDDSNEKYRNMSDYLKVQGLYPLWPTFFFEKNRPET